MGLTNSCLSLIHLKAGISEGRQGALRPPPPTPSYRRLQQQEAVHETWLIPARAGEKTSEVFSDKRSVWQGLGQAALKPDASARAPPTTMLLGEALVRATQQKYWVGPPPPPPHAALTG